MSRHLLDTITRAENYLRRSAHCEATNQLRMARLYFNAAERVMGV